MLKNHSLSFIIATSLL